jgi:hypothetical protein
VVLVAAAIEVVDVVDVHSSTAVVIIRPTTVTGPTATDPTMTARTDTLADLTVTDRNVAAPLIAMSQPLYAIHWVPTRTGLSMVANNQRS